MNPLDCCDDLKTMTSVVDRLEQKVRSRLESVNGSDDDLLEIADSARDIRNRVSDLFRRLCAEPSSKFLSGYRLSREQYYLTRAMGSDLLSAFELGLSPVPDHVLLHHMYYADDNIRCYVNPAAQVRNADPDVEQRVGLRFGRPPEDLSRRSLRREQLAFLERYLPNVLSRFGP